MKKSLLLVFVLLTMFTQTACWETPETNKVLVQSIYGKPTQVVRPPGVWTVFTRGDKYTPISLESNPTEDIDVRAQSADNANFICKVRLQYAVPNNDQEILKLAAKFGFNEESRNNKIMNALYMELQSRISNKAKAFTTYDILDKYEAMRGPLMEEMKAFFQSEMHLTLENLQFSSKPDFDNNDIDAAASNIIAAQQRKSVAIADLERTKVEAETRQVQSQTFAQSPQLMELEKLKLQKEIAAAWAGHQGALVFGGNNTPLQLNIR